MRLSPATGDHGIRRAVEEHYPVRMNNGTEWKICRTMFSMSRSFFGRQSRESRTKIFH
jgi:hypothetical protein